MFSHFIVFAWLCLCLAHAYTLRSTGSITFPLQQVEPTEPNSFIRIYHSTSKTLRCPKDFVFNSEELKCVVKVNYTSNRTKHAYKAGRGVCPQTYRGTLLNPTNCRSFYNCWDGHGYVMPCNDHLLYSEQMLRCDWPESAGCCEYWEKNSSLIVQSS